MNKPVTKNKDEYEDHLEEQTPKWFAVYTRYKREKLIVKELERKGIRTYLPLQKVTRQWERKKKTVELPLINCYLFVHITKSDYIKVLETENVVKFVRFSKNLISIPDQEIEILKRIVGEGIFMEVHEGHYVEGDEVEISSGNLTGLKGKLIAKESEHNFLIELSHVGYAFRMSVAPELLKKVNASKTVY